MRGTLAQDAEVKIEAEDSPDGLVAITVTAKDAGEEEDEEEEEGEPGGEEPALIVPKSPR